MSLEDLLFCPQYSNWNSSAVEHFGCGSRQYVLHVTGMTLKLFPENGFILGSVINYRTQEINKETVTE